MAYSEFGAGFDYQNCAETLIIENLVDNERGYARGPERALMSALLFDGVQSYMNYFGAESESARAKYKEAYNWVHSNENEYIFSFVNVCEAVGIDANYLRLGLINVCCSESNTWKKTRRNF
jgi:hypothetical protein